MVEKTFAPSLYWPAYPASPHSRRDSMSANPKSLEADLAPFRLLINGKLVPGATTMDVINPATGKSFVQCPRADQAQLNEAVAAAKAAFPAWSRKSWDERRRLLLALADALLKHQDEFARLMTLE